MIWSFFCALGAFWSPFAINFIAHRHFFEYPLVLLAFWFFAVLISTTLWTRLPNSLTTWGPIRTLLWTTWFFLIINHFSIKIETLATLPHGKKITILLALVLGFLITRVKNSKTVTQNMGVFSLFLCLGVLPELSPPDLWKLPNLKDSARAAANESIVTSKTPPLQTAQHTFLIVLDMFSYEHATPAVVQAAKDLSKKHSLSFYQNHFSGHPTTVRSLPQIIGNKSRTWDQEGNLLYGEHSLFKKFSELNYNVHIFGQAHSYCRLYGQFAVFCNSEPGRSPHLMSYLLLELAKSLQIFATTLHPNLLSIYTSKLSKDAVLRIPESALTQIDSFKGHLQKLKNTYSFSFLHSLFPHSPFVTNSDCSIRENDQGKDHNLDFSQEQRLRYEKQALCAIRQLDQFFSKLKRHNLSQNSRVLVLSDHGREGRKIQDDLPMSNQDIRNTAHIFAWSYNPSQREEFYETAPTSNAHIQSFLFGEEPSLPNNHPVTFHRSEKETYISTDGEQWERHVKE